MNHFYSSTGVFLFFNWGIYPFLPICKFCVHRSKIRPFVCLLGNKYFLQTCHLTMYMVFCITCFKILSFMLYLISPVLFYDYKNIHITFLLILLWIPLLSGTLWYERGTNKPSCTSSFITTQRIISSDFKKTELDSMSQGKKNCKEILNRIQLFQC